MSERSPEDRMIEEWRERALDDRIAAMQGGAWPEVLPDGFLGTLETAAPPRNGFAWILLLVLACLLAAA